ncbi:MurR/RpiR family transcriptional regulator [Pseudactinotalea terrae]|uniref:MurR/RpiR family transcriptional regulator n=1 Tax=Pseudactinotalea terrae TaxID=1743262 RepID=UPI0012E1FA05|nr:MurR/RpiR family transcriptional regulator [Pseudactinotalea terrae]
MDSAATNPTDSLREALPSLRGAARRLAEHLLHEPERAARASVTVLAQECGVAPSTVSRLAARLGYEGFPDLRAALATEHGRALQGGWERDIGTELKADDPPQRLLEGLAAQQHRAAQASLARLDAATADTIASLIAAAPRVLLHGGWADAIALEELRLRLLRLGIAVWLHADATAARVAAGMVGEHDLLLVLSRSGADPDSADLIDRAAARGAHTALVTGDPDGPLAAKADHVLGTGVRSTTWTSVFAGRASDTLACSLLWLLVAQRTPDSLGRLHDLLHPDSENPR